MKTTQFFTALMAVVASLMFVSSAFAFEGNRLTGVPVYSGGSSVPVPDGAMRTTTPDPDGILHNLNLQRGPQGDQGEPGPAGATGATGQPGQSGTSGAKGDAGDTGSRGRRGHTGNTGGRGPGGPAGQNGKNADSTQIYREITTWNPASQSYVTAKVAQGVGQSKDYTNGQVANGVAQANGYTNGVASSLQSQINNKSDKTDDSVQKGPKMDYSGLYWLAGLLGVIVLIITVVWLSTGSADRRAAAETAAINAAADRREREATAERNARQARQDRLDAAQLAVAQQLANGQFRQVAGVTENKMVLNGVGAFTYFSDTRGKKVRPIQQGDLTRRREAREAAAANEAGGADPRP